MKKILPLILIFYVLLSCDKDEIIGYEKIEIESYILENYTKDAKHLYMDKIISDSSHPNYNNPLFDENEITKILKIIQAVFNSVTQQRDTVFEIYQIHKYPCYSFHSIYLEVSPELPEIINLVNKVFPTGNSALDNILYTYNFDSVKTLYNYPKSPYIVLYTNDEYNMIPIENEFAEIESIQIIESIKNINCIGTDYGDNMALHRNSNSAIISFGIGRGDCPSGCTFQKNWEFKVSNGSARFNRTYK